MGDILITQNWWWYSIGNLDIAISYILLVAVIELRQQHISKQYKPQHSSKGALTQMTLPPP